MDFSVSHGRMKVDFLFGKYFMLFLQDVKFSWKKKGQRKRCVSIKFLWCLCLMLYSDGDSDIGESDIEKKVIDL